MTKRDTGFVPETFLWIAAVWFGFGLIDATQTVAVMRSEGMHHAWAQLFLATLLSWVPWAVATPFIMHFGRNFPPARFVSYRIWPAHVAAYLAIGLTSSLWSAGLERFVNPYEISVPQDGFVKFWFDKFDTAILSSLVLYAGILTLSYVLDSRERLASGKTEAARLNERLANAQLDALRRQIEPHFLFNTLSAITGLVREGRSDAAVNVIEALSNFLRRMLEHSARQEVSLEDELAFAQQYLDIQKVRFADRLELIVDVPRELYSAPVPHLILQPLVENAIKHGISKRPYRGTIRIAASQCDETLTLSVYNDGPSLPRDWETSRAGIGVANVRARLRGLYGDRFALNMWNRDSSGVEVSLSLPLRMLGDSVTR